MHPTEEFLKSILKFPIPTILMNIRSWCGTFDQVSYAFSDYMIMEPLQNALSNKAAFTWPPSSKGW